MIEYGKRYLQSYDESITMKYPYDSFCTNNKQKDEKECMNKNNKNLNNEGAIKNKIDPIVPVRHNNLLLMGVVVPTDNDDENDQNNDCTEGNCSIHEKIEYHNDNDTSTTTTSTRRHQYIPLPMISTTSTRDKYYMEIIQCQSSY